MRLSLGRDLKSKSGGVGGDGPGRGSKRRGSNGGKQSFPWISSSVPRVKLSKGPKTALLGCRFFHSTPITGMQ